MNLSIKMISWSCSRQNAKVSICASSAIVLSHFNGRGASLLQICASSSLFKDNFMLWGCTVHKNQQIEYLATKLHFAFLECLPFGREEFHKSNIEATIFRQVCTCPAMASQYWARRNCDALPPLHSPHSGWKVAQSCQGMHQVCTLAGYLICISILCTTFYQETHHLSFNIGVRDEATCLGWLGMSARDGGSGWARGAIIGMTIKTGKFSVSWRFCLSTFCTLLDELAILSARAW